MKSLLRFALVAFGLILTPISAHAAACSTTAYAKTAGNFSNTTTTWATTSGGGTACTLTAGNAVVFDGGSGAGSYTIDESISISSLTTVGATAGIFLLHNTGDTLTINNTTSSTTFNLSGVSYCNANPCTAPVSSARAIAFTNTGGTVSITAGSSTTSPYNQLGTVTFNGSGGTFELLDNAILQGTPAFTAGTIDLTTNNPTVTFGTTLTIPAVGILNCGTGTLVFTSSIVSFTTTSGATIACSTGTFNFSTAANGAMRTFSASATGSSASFGTVIINTAGATGISRFYFSTTSGLTITIGTFTLTNAGNVPLSMLFSSNTGITFTNLPTTLSGTSGNFISFIGSNTATTETLTLPTSSPLALNWNMFCNITFAGTSSPVTATNSIDLCGVPASPFNGGSISEPTFGAGGGHIIGG